jgi:hypothetical protein
MRPLNRNSSIHSAVEGLKAFVASRSRDRRLILVMGGCFLLSLLIILIFTQFGTLFTSVYPANFQVGQVAEQDFVVNRDLQYVDAAATRLKQDAAQKLVSPVFQLNEEVTARVLERFELFQKTFLAVIGEESTAEKIFLRMQLLFPGVLDQKQIGPLVGHSFLEGLLVKTQSLLAETLSTGLIDPSRYERELFSSDSVELWRWRKGLLEKEVMPLSRALTPQSLSFSLVERLAGYSPENIRLATSLVESFAVENAFLDLEQTRKNRQKAMDDVSPVEAKLFEGQIIVRRGDLVSEEAAAKIRAVGEYANTVNLSGSTGTALYLLVLIGLCLFLLGPQVIRPRLKWAQVLFLAVAAVTYLFLSAVLIRTARLPEWLPFSVLLPTGAWAMLVAMVVSPGAAVAFSWIVSAGLYPLVQVEVFTFLFAALSGLAGTAVVVQAERRIDLMRGGAYLALINCLILSALVLLRGYQPGWLLPALGWGIFNGLASGILSLGLLPIIEHLLNAATRFRLRELSDLNAPIFKRMLSLAPGTYTHSISVANLAESACTGIQANALLARVGAYYHDVGKIDQAEYFIENQRAFNKHDELKPSLSAAVIKAHVKLGVEKARDLSLPSEVVDIIAQHHGRAVIRYFYNRALESEGSKSVAVEDYSYPGVRPQTREAAVVMLADAVDAASRVLKKPGMSKLEKFVWDIIMEKFTANELNESSLTLRDMEIIKKSFIQILAGYFHSRIEYPKTREDAARNQPEPVKRQAH